MEIGIRAGIVAEGVADTGVVLPGYDRFSQILHWITAVLMLLVLVPLGLYAAWLGEGPVRAYLLDHWHKPIGLLIIALTLVRLAWKAMRPAVAEASGLKLWERWLAAAAHGLLYALLLAIPLSGLLMSQGAGRPTSFFGLFSIPQMLPLTPGIPPHDQPAYQIGALLHRKLLTWALYLIVAMHVAGALKHRFVDNHRDYFRRMWGRSR